MKKRILTLGTLSIVLVLAGAGCSKTSSSTDTTDDTNQDNVATVVEPMKYKDFKANITLYYPSNWKEQRQSEINTVFFYPQAQTDVSRTNLAFTTQNLSDLQDVTLDQYTDIIKADTSKNLQNVNILSSEKTTVGGLEAGVLTYTANYPGITDELVKVYHTYVIKDKTAYLLTYTSVVSKYEKYLQNAKDIVNSFQFN